MKIYRVIPDTFMHGERSNETDYIGVEDIYYHGGYISFRDKKTIHKYNTIYQNMSLEEKRKAGKYFYLFPEDAVRIGYILLNFFHHLKNTQFMITEYDVPIDIIMKYIGYGNYSLDIIKDYIPECFIMKEDFKGILKTSSQISLYEKNDMLMESFKQRIQALKGLKDIYSDVYESAKMILDDEILWNSSYYQEFMKTEADLVETPYITGTSVYLNAKLVNREKIEEYFQKMNFPVDHSEDRMKFKEELLYYLDYHNKENQEKVKTLLKEYQK